MIFTWDQTAFSDQISRVQWESSSWSALVMEGLTAYLQFLDWFVKLMSLVRNQRKVWDCSGIRKEQDLHTFISHTKKVSEISNYFCFQTPHFFFIKGDFFPLNLLFLHVHLFSTCAFYSLFIFYVNFNTLLFVRCNVIYT